MKKTTAITPVEHVQRYILLIRNQKVILDRDLADLYGVETKALNQAVRRNIKRFPPDFMFQLTKVEKKQLVTNCDRFEPLKYSTSMPHAFTEHGAVMAASVLNSDRAVAVSIYVVRAFIKLRQMLKPYKELMRKLERIEKKLQTHDEQITTLIAIRQLMSLIDEKHKPPIGFHTEAKRYGQKVKKKKAKKKKTKR